MTAREDEQPETMFPGLERVLKRHHREQMEQLSIIGADVSVLNKRAQIIMDRQAKLLELFTKPHIEITPGQPQDKRT